VVNLHPLTPHITPSYTKKNGEGIETINSVTSFHLTYKTLYHNAVTKQVYVDPRPSDRNVKRWPLLLSGAGRQQTDRRTNGRSPTHRRLLLEAASVSKKNTAVQCDAGRERAACKAFNQHNTALERRRLRLVNHDQQQPYKHVRQGRLSSLWSL